MKNEIDNVKFVCMVSQICILATFPEWGAESVPNKNASKQWLEAVDEEEYLKLK